MIFNGGSISPSVLKLLLVVFTVIYMVYVVGLTFVNTKILEKGVNVD